MQISTEIPACSAFCCTVVLMAGLYYISTFGTWRTQRTQA